MGDPCQACDMKCKSVLVFFFNVFVSFFVLFFEDQLVIPVT